MHKLYFELYQQKLFQTTEAYKLIKNRQVCRNTLNRFINKKLIHRIRNGIYYIIPLDNPDFYPNPIHIATCLRDDAVICCTSALAAQGLWNQEDNIYAYTLHPSKIRIRDTTYKLIKSYGKFGEDKIEYDSGYFTIKIKATDLERSIIDCLRTRITTFEEMIAMIKLKKPSIIIKKIMKYLEYYKKPILYNKLGLILDICSAELAISQDDLKNIKSKLSKKTFYLKEKGLSLVKPRYKYYGKWNIMLPQQIMDLTSKPTI